MLSELYIRDFAIIDQLRLQFNPGFNVLTGETGAGKSIILDAVMLVLGERADTTMVRAGSDIAYVEALFQLDEAAQAYLQPLLEAEGLEGETAEFLSLGRELRLNGRNICRINGRAVNLSLLRQIGETLIDIHGQGEHLSLLHPRSHLPLLDAYASVAEERAAVAEQVARLRQVRRELSRLRQDERTLVQHIDLLRFQIQDIRAAKLEENEEEELRAERTRLANVEQLSRHAAEATMLLGGDSDETPSVVDLLGEAERAVSQMARYDETQEPLAERLQGLAYEISEVAGELADYQEGLEFNPARLNQVEERLELIRQLKRKYGDTIAEILAVADAAEAELDQISHSEERIEALTIEEESLLRQIGRLAQTLSERRQAAAERLSRAVDEQLADLHMVGAHFEVDFQTEPDPEGAFVGDERLAFDQTGFDRVEFLITTNPGEPLKPMARVASGGETSRLMLALKTALAAVDATPTLIFDEIDQGIGGRVGDIVGRKLWGLTAVGGHQVIVVTHLPQLAGYGDVHFHVSKHSVDNRTTTRVVHLDGQGRIEELAAMLGTHGQHAHGGAQEILQQAAVAKETA